jgi:hypothetical protein
VDVATFLQRVANTYNRTAGLGAETQLLLRRAGQHLSHVVPAGIEIKGSGGKGLATFTPWVGFFDPDETSTPEEGLYLVYLFAADLKKVHLILLLGVTVIDNKIGDHAAARAVLRAEADAIRSRLNSAALVGLQTSVDLASKGWRQLAYAAPCVAAVGYDTQALPADQDLRRDLARFFELYQESIAAKRVVALARSEVVTEAAAVHEVDVLQSPLAYFQPKSDADYVARLTGRSLVKTRRHERLIREYGEWISSLGFRPSTSEHPRDLVLRSQDGEWLVEAKVVYRGNATEAVRAAIGQLLTYRHMLYPKNRAPQLAALFTEPIGDAYVDLLEDLHIVPIWRELGRWVGPKAAAHFLLAETIAARTGTEQTSESE